MKLERASTDILNAPQCFGAREPSAKRNSARSAAIRCRESVAVSRREQVAGLWNCLLVKRQQPNFRRGVRLDRAVMEDVAGSDAASGETARHQETAMTIERFALGAHQTNA
jgi:hypothetical protein